MSAGFTDKVVRNTITTMKCFKKALRGCCFSGRSVSGSIFGLNNFFRHYAKKDIC